MPDDVILNKAELIERNMKRARETYAQYPSASIPDEIIQDAIVFSLERACQAAIGLGMRWVRLETLGVPKESKDAFTLLADAGRISRELASSLGMMVDFRNKAIFKPELDFASMKAVIERDFPEFRELIALALREARDRRS